MARKSKSQTASALTARMRAPKAWKPSQVVLVFQGGGALGAYQAGVYQALHEAGIEPDWVIGTSIGAINGSLIAGNEPAQRLPALIEFWRRMGQSSPSIPFWPQLSHTLSQWKTMSGGIAGFFTPNPQALLGPHVPLGSDHAAYYSTAPLRETLSELVNFERIAGGSPRLTVGAAHVRSSRMKYFDSHRQEKPITAAHILASGALPPAFPAVRIEGELYWDGGIVSNTPSEVIFEDDPRRDSLIFSVHLWNPDGPEPSTLWDVETRVKDIRYSSRVAGHIKRQRQIHTLRQVVSQLAALVPESIRHSAPIQDLAVHGCATQMHIASLLVPRLDNEDQTKDVDFSQSGIESRWNAGLSDTRTALAQAPWDGEFDPIEGVVLHEFGGTIGLSRKAPR